jgi:RNA polymerase sigma-70 factor (TIGR02943 family)
MQAPPTSQNNTLSPGGWVDNYADYLYSYAYSRVSDEEVARDLVQDTFLSALKAKDSYKGAASEKTWLVSILKRKIIDQYRRAAVRKESSFEESEAYKVAYGHYFTEDGFMPGDWHKAHAPREWNLDKSRIEQNEFRRVLLACLGRLPKAWAAVFSMKHMDEESSENICKELNISASNFWVIIHRAKLQMRECLEKNWFKA